MKTLNCHFGLNHVWFLPIILFSCCLKNNHQEISCNISWLGKNEILIELQNYTQENLYFSNGRLLTAGIRIFKINKTNCVDLTASFREEMTNNFEYLNTESCENSFKIENELTIFQEDSLVNLAYELNDFWIKSENLRIRDLIHGILMIKPGQIFKECFKLPAAFSKDTLVIFYQYPYKSVWDYQTLSEDLKTIVAKYERIRLPDEILGYKRYKNVVLQSNYLIYYPSN